MTVGHVGMKHPSLAGMVDAITVPMTREVMHARFTPQAEAFLETCLRQALNRSVNDARPIQTALLDPFKRVLLFDSSSWDVDPHLADVLPGSGGGASAANCKLQVGYEYKHGKLGFFKIDPGTRPDNAHTTQLPSILQTGDLALPWARAPCESDRCAALRDAGTLCPGPCGSRPPGPPALPPPA